MTCLPMCQNSKAWVLEDQLAEEGCGYHFLLYRWRLKSVNSAGLKYARIPMRINSTLVNIKKTHHEYYKENKYVQKLKILII